MATVIGRFFTSRKKAKQFKKDHRPTYFIIQRTAGGFLVITPQAFLAISRSLKKDS